MDKIMTVAALIEVLKTRDPDQVVLVLTPSSGGYDYKLQPIDDVDSMWIMKDGVGQDAWHIKSEALSYEPDDNLEEVVAIIPNCHVG